MANTSMNSSGNSQESIRDDAIDDHDGPLPGFRFHPTDEELVSFYLKRKVENRKPLSIEIIKEIDIYKHDPWDLAKGSSSIGDKEWYFYCKRGRKYKNSIRPNRVTGSGFWKATGIDRPIYSNGGEGHECIGLKKSLVYYRGSAGKGTKTDWMMHEFRLPTDQHQQPYHNEVNVSNSKDTAQEAEIWTLCRIFKRSKRQTPDWRELSSRKTTVNSSSKTSSLDSNTNQECYISFGTQQIATTSNNNAANYTNNNIYVANHDSNNSNNNPYIGNHTSDVSTTGDHQKNNDVHFHANHQQQWNNNSMVHHTPPSAPSTSLHPSMLNNLVLTNNEPNDLQSFAYYGHNWDDLNSVVQFAANNKPY